MSFPRGSTTLPLTHRLIVQSSTAYYPLCCFEFDRPHFFCCLDMKTYIQACMERVPVPRIAIILFTLLTLFEVCIIIGLSIVLFIAKGVLDTEEVLTLKRVSDPLRKCTDVTWETKSLPSCGVGKVLAPIDPPIYRIEFDIFPTNSCMTNIKEANITHALVPGQKYTVKYNKSEIKSMVPVGEPT